MNRSIDGRSDPPFLFCFQVFVRDVAIRPPLVLDGRAARALGFFDPAFAPMEVWVLIVIAAVIAAVIPWLCVCPFFFFVFCFPFCSAVRRPRLLPPRRHQGPDGQQLSRPLRSEGESGADGDGCSGGS